MPATIPARDFEICVIGCRRARSDARWRWIDRTGQDQPDPMRAVPLSRSSAEAFALEYGHDNPRHEFAVVALPRTLTNA